MLSNIYSEHLAWSVLNVHMYKKVISSSRHKERTENYWSMFLPGWNTGFPQSFLQRMKVKKPFSLNSWFQRSHFIYLFIFGKTLGSYLKSMDYRILYSWVIWFPRQNLITGTKLEADPERQPCLFGSRQAVWYPDTKEDNSELQSVAQLLGSQLKFSSPWELKEIDRLIVSMPDK